MGSIVLPCQSDNTHQNERSMTEHVSTAGTSQVVGAATTQLQSILDMTDDAGGTVNAIGAYTNPATQYQNAVPISFCIPLNSGILNNEKLLPLMLMSAPLTIEIELAPSLEPVCWATDATGTYTISNVRYIANLIEVGGDVAQQLRMVQEMSGGVLTLAGQTYRHFTGAITGGGTGDQIINVPARVKSMKSMFWSSQGATGIAFGNYSVSYGGNMSLNNYQLKIGSVVYPPTPVNCGFGDGTNGTGGAGASKSEAIMELAKAWGNVGSRNGLGQLSKLTCYSLESAQPTTQGIVAYSPFGIDLEAFQRVAIESGVNTADRSLPISLVLGFSNAPTATNVDVYVLADALFYINADGSMSVSV